MAMKSAYELAMERLGGEGAGLSDETKRKLAEIDEVYQAKIAETRIMFEARISAAGADREKLTEAQDALRDEIARMERRRESAKDKVRGKG